MSERGIGRGSAGIHQGCSWDSRGAASGHKGCTVTNAEGCNRKSQGLHSGIHSGPRAGSISAGTSA
eukprot:6071646-Alexandrium_andersonii.AAC.1